MKWVKLFLLLFLFLICGCKHNTISNGEEDIKVTIDNLNVDNYFVKGIKEQKFRDIPKRVVVVGENETETLLELGLEKNILMAVAQNSRRYDMHQDNAEKFNRLPKCSSGNLNMEYILHLKPDLIVAQQCIFVKNRLNNTDYWNNRGINTLIPLNTNTPSKHIIKETVVKEMQFISNLGNVFDVNDKAQEIINNTYTTIKKINKLNRPYKKPKVMVIEFLSAIICYDETKLVGNMITSIGGHVTTSPAVISWENIIKEDPDILFVVCSHKEYGQCINNVIDNVALRNLRCIKEKRVYSIPLRFTYGTGCRTEDGIKFLAKHMYPQIEI